MTIKKTLQYDLMDCGPACLSFICSYYNNPYSIDFLRNSSCIDKNGVSLLGISKAAEEIGFITQGGWFTFNTLVEDVQLPCILHWNQEHFVVLFKISKKRKKYLFHINDPAKGLLVYSKEELLQSWISTQTNKEQKGVGLLLEPTSKFFSQKEENQKDVKKKGKLVFLGKYIVSIR